MGFVRLMRSGGLHYCSNAIRFVPDVDDVVTFADMVTEAQLGQVTQEAARLFDRAVGDLRRNFAEGTEYFDVLVNVFASDFRDKKNVHLHNFHLIVPPLTLNFVDTILSAKDRLGKRNKNDAAFTDDGFAMGVAYILRLCDLEHEFDSLHWFESMADKFAKERSAQQAVIASSSKDQGMRNAAEMRLRVVEQQSEEFELLRFSLNSARVFFRSKTDSKDAAEVCVGCVLSTVLCCSAHIPSANAGRCGSGRKR
jgi:WASH complex subunit 7